MTQTSGSGELRVSARPGQKGALTPNRGAKVNQAVPATTSTSSSTSAPPAKASKRSHTMTSVKSVGGSISPTRQSNSSQLQSQIEQGGQADQPDPMWQYLDHDTAMSQQTPEPSGPRRTGRNADSMRMNMNKENAVVDTDYHGGMPRSGEVLEMVTAEQLELHVEALNSEIGELKSSLELAALAQTQEILREVAAGRRKGGA
jgi:hypothetical protein